MTPARYAYVDALRGLAILGVMVVHSGQQFPILGPTFASVTGKGAFGVQLFFVASALTLTMSSKARHEGIAPFYIRRLFRIAPLFWLAIPAFLVLYGTGPRYWAPNGLTLFDIASTAVFLHGWWPTSINSVVPGGWSIAVEMMFYLIFPFIIVRLHSLQAAVGVWALAAVFAYLAAHLLPRLSDDYLTNTFFALWLPSQLHVFAVGIAVYFAIQRFDVGSRAADMLVMACVVSTISVYMLTGKVPGLPLVVPVLFGFLAYSLSKGGVRFLVSRPLIALGKISFGAYLWHFAVIALLTPLLNRFPPTLVVAAFYFVVVVLTTSMLAVLTYRSIEVPMINAGRRVALMFGSVPVHDKELSNAQLSSGKP